MSKRTPFPITIKAGATAIKIYRSPLKVSASVKPSAEGNGTPANRSDAPSTKVYDSYMVSFYRGGKRERKRFASLELARGEAERVRTSLLNEDLAALQLTGQDRLVYVRAGQVAAKLGIALDTLAQEFLEARKILGDVSVLAAAKFYAQHGQSIRRRANTADVVEELLAGFQADHKSGYYLHSMTQRLERFAEDFPGPILDIRTEQITDWLRKLKGKGGGGKPIKIAAKTRNHYRDAVVTLFNFSRDNGYLPKGLPTEAEAVKSVDEVPSENQILTVEEMTRLLNAAPDYLLPVLAIKAFTGIRTEEMMRIQWGRVDFEKRCIILTADVTKTKQRRLIPMAQNLFVWLYPFAGKTGRIAARWKNPQTFVQALDRYGKRLGIDLGANKFRNSYISYRVAATQDIPRVALEGGNSPQIIQREYLELATEDDGKRWFAIFPEKKAAGTATSTKIDGEDTLIAIAPNAMLTPQS